MPFVACGLSPSEDKSVLRLYLQGSAAVRLHFPQEAYCADLDSDGTCLGFGLFRLKKQHEDVTLTKYNGPHTVTY